MMRLYRWLRFNDLNIAGYAKTLRLMKLFISHTTMTSLIIVDQTCRRCFNYSLHEGMTYMQQKRKCLFLIKRISDLEIIIQKLPEYY